MLGARVTLLHRLEFGTGAQPDPNIRIAYSPILIPLYSFQLSAKAEVRVFLCYSQ
jgi:hypothetical protein